MNAAMLKFGSPDDGKAGTGPEALVKGAAGLVEHFKQLFNVYSDPVCNSRLVAFRSKLRARTSVMTL